MTPGDLDIMARTIYGEARGQPYEGKKAVAHVILNRLLRYVNDNTISKVCLRHLQFSCWNRGDPNVVTLQTVPLDDLQAATSTDKEFRSCLRAALEAFDEEDFTKGATHYHTPAVSPPWSQGKTPCLVIGGHRFFNNID